MFGGGDSNLNLIELTYPDGTKTKPHNKDLITGVPKGTVYYQVAQGGGGYGDPKTRPADRVADEVRNGVVSLNAARDTYGVVVDPKTYGVDEAATAELRA